jgi:type III secretion protein V
MEKATLPQSPWNALWRGGDLRAVLGRYADVALAVVVVGTVAMMIVPLPGILLDVFVTANIAAAVVLVLVAIYVSEALKIATFPTILLLTTLFRVAIEVSATRLILLHGNAGGVIDAFGRFVVGGNLVVGIVVFLILTMVQFVVVAKGAERVAEVGARFTLDAMPGKQLGIDAELRAGHIDREEAHRQRQRLARESQFFGAMDGAMKFVKGDAIAGLLVLAVNIVGGLLIGVFQRHLPFADAAKTYTILTIGEGLVSQIPALLISTAAGVLVTRVSAEQEGGALGRDIGNQILAHPRALAFAAGLLALLALVPGLPAVPFLILALVLGWVAQRLLRHPLAETKEALTTKLDSKGSAGYAARMPGPLALRLGLDLAKEFGASPGGDGTRLKEVLLSLRNELFDRRGIPVADIAVDPSERLAPRDFQVLLHDVPVSEGTCPTDSLLAISDTGRLNSTGLVSVPARLPDGRQGAWIEKQAATGLPENSLQFLPPTDLVALHISETLKRHAHELLGVQETQTLLDALTKQQPSLVDEAVPKLVSVSVISEVLRQLAQERVSLRNIRAVLEAVVAAPIGNANEVRSIASLVQASRQGLRRAITRQHANSHGEVAAFILDPMVEDVLRDSLARGGDNAAVEPDLIDDVLTGARTAFGNVLNPVVLTSSRIRRSLWKLLSAEIPDVTVISYDELLPDTQIETMGYISPGS